MFLWQNVSTDRHILLSSLGIERRTGGWTPVQIDETGTAYRLGARVFTEEKARAEVERLAGEKPHTRLIPLAGKPDPQYLGISGILAATVILALYPICNPILYAPLAVLISYFFFFSAWAASVSKDGKDRP